MTRCGNLSRRSLLKILGALLGSASIRSREAVALQTANRLRDPVVLQALTLFKHRKSALLIGIYYLKGRPDEADREVLIASVFHGNHHLTISSTPDIQSLRNWLQRRRREDFECGRTVNINGWILAETEVRLCALLLLEAKSL